ncbi:MAG: hypothetical protein NTX35_02985 [Verrucomicrobia bacterium]|nr:hypothetical protein [Verrucomicrobiota bacterium]
MKRRSLLKLTGAAGAAAQADIASLAKEAAQVDTWDPKALGDPKAKRSLQGTLRR